MAFKVHIHVCFACDDNTPIAVLARDALEVFDSEEDGAREAKWFLESLASRSGTNPGPKGGLSFWGLVGNYTDADRFVDVLRPFFRNVLGDSDGGPCSHERILVFSEREQSEAATCHEIFWEDDNTREKLVVRKHEQLPFSWMQF